MAAATPIVRLTPYSAPILRDHPVLANLDNFHTGTHASKYNFYKMDRTITNAGISYKSYEVYDDGAEIGLDNTFQQFKVDLTIPWDLELLSEGTKILRNRAQVAQRWAEATTRVR